MGNMGLKSERLANTVIRMAVIAESHDRVRSTAALVDKVAFIALGCFAIIIIGIVESYLIRGGKLGVLPHRIARVFGIQLLAFAALDLLSRPFISIDNWYGPSKRVFYGQTLIGLAAMVFSLMPRYQRTSILLNRVKALKSSKTDGSQTRTGMD
jgi:hypothetical protein